jgi:hypothetical protein
MAFPRLLLFTPTIEGSKRWLCLEALMKFG